MGQVKSKGSWRRLSDSDCLHLLQEEYSDRSLEPPKLTTSNRRWSISPSDQNLEDSSTARLIKFQVKTSPNSSLKVPNLSTISTVKNTTPNHFKAQVLPTVRPIGNIVKPRCLLTDDVPEVVPISPLEPNPIRARPISMFPMDTAMSKSKFRLSLSDLLERINTFDEHSEEDDVEDFSAQTMTPEMDTSDDKLVQLDQVARDKVEKKTPAIRCSGLDCMCDRCVAIRFKLLNWLLPNCTRLNAERLLSGRAEGTFLVRKSEKFPGQYTLSFVCKRAVRHCLIMRSVYGFGLRWPYSFSTLQQVIVHYTRQSLAEFNSKLDVRLRYPVFMA